jgi:RHS repeat-associated protein
VISEYNAYWHNGKIPDYMFNAKEFDEENGMYYYEARYYNPPMFISRDPLFEKYPFMSPYAYTANNPLRYIDPTGKDVEITGAEKKSAFKELKAGAARHDIKVKINKNGQITGKYTGKGEISSEGQQILNAINDKSVKVNINATDGNTTDGKQPFFGGSFLGSTLTSESTATARQDVNPSDLRAISSNYSKPGQDMLHEVTEAYQGGLLAIEIGKSVSNSLVDKSNYDIAHARAIPQSGNIYEGNIRSNGIGSTFGTFLGKYWEVDHPKKGRIEIKEWRK